MQKNIKKTKTSVVVSIFKSHVRRLGFARATIGGWLLYTTMPLFIFLHTTVTALLYSFILRPTLNLPKYKFRSYIILDRYYLDGLSAFDRFNCLFCEYAMGITMLLNTEVDAIAHTRFKKNWYIVNILLYILISIQTFFLILFVFLTSIPTYIFMTLLGYNRVSSRRIIQLLKEKKYSRIHPVHIKCIIYIHKLIAVVLIYNLTQIEQQWCPIKHLQKAGQIIPKHHKAFVDRDKIILLKEILLSDGGVAKDKNKHKNENIDISI